MTYRLFSMSTPKENVKLKPSLYVSNLDVHGQEEWKPMEVFQQRAIAIQNYRNYISKST